MAVSRFDVLDGAGAFSPPSTGEATHFAEHLRWDTLSVGTYSIPAGGRDDQGPHAEDEVYVVTGGRARITVGGRAVDLRPGAVVAVPARAEHRFHDIEEDLSLLVFFAPPYSGD